MGRTESRDEEVTGIRHTTTGPLLVGLLGPRCGNRRNGPVAQPDGGVPYQLSFSGCTALTWQDAQLLRSEFPAVPWKNS